MTESGFGGRSDLLGRDRSALDYFALLKAGNTMPAENGPSDTLALLADASTQQLAPLLRALFKAHNQSVDVYEAPFDGIEVEAYNPTSGLYGCGATAIAILLSAHKIRERYYATAVHDRADFTEQ